jgi:hypothetical protein
MYVYLVRDAERERENGKEVGKGAGGGREQSKAGVWANEI